MSSSRSAAPPAKRQRRFGAATEDDTLSVKPTYNNASNDDRVSTREISSTQGVPTLANICARVFVKHIQKLSADPELWDPTRAWLKIIPDTLINKLFAMLRTSCPTILSHGFIISNFLRGLSIILTSDLPGVNRFTIEAVPQAAESLRELHLTGFEKFSDNLIASIFPKLLSLQVLVLRGCTKVGATTAQAVATSCSKLTSVNFGYTAVTPVSIASLILACPDLEVLKLAGVQNWTDANAAKLLSALPQDAFQLPKMRKLKLRHTSLSDVSISALLIMCPNLESLDISFTLVKSPHKNIDFEEHPSKLQKLNLTSTSISGADVVTISPHLSLLKTLSIGALGSRQGSTLAITNSSAMTLTEKDLGDLTQVVSKFKHIETVNLVGNTKLGLTSRIVLPDFMQQVGRRCKKLNLAGITALRSRDLDGLTPTDEDPDVSSLEWLNLNNTGIDDDVVPYISCCPNLKSLEVAGTKLTSEALFTIIDACPKLEKLDLTSCRGVRVKDRRRFFELWEEQKDG